ncbi:MAG: NADH-quinone oxidoreductase subunit I [Planctomycetes bacterium]|nr:NADH-quinone oxidoreductase subunit I [Planctomycetota bacterium]
MAIKVVRRPTLTLWEKTYLPQILRGLRITSGHFFRNLFLHTAHVFGRFKDVPASVTIQYPEQQRGLMSRFRSRHRLMSREDDTPRCVGCMLCETICPAKCITIVPDEHPNPTVEKYPVSFDINLGMCVYCGYCVEVCPEDAIRMDTGILDVASYSRDGMKLDIHQLLDPGLRKPIATCNLDFPHKCGVSGGEMKGSWNGSEGRS